MKKNLLLFFLLLTSCYKNNLYVQVENIDRDFLASTHVHTPDYRQKNPPCGQRVIVSWDFPKRLYRQDLSIYLTVRFWDNTQVIRSYKIPRKWGTKSFYFANKEKSKGKKILTYRVQIVTKEKKIIETWQHQFWTELIDVDKE